MSLGAHAFLLGVYLGQEMLGAGVCRGGVDNTLPLLGGGANFPVNVFSRVFCPFPHFPTSPPHILGSPYAKLVTILDTRSAFSHP